MARRSGSDSRTQRRKREDDPTRSRSGLSRIIAEGKALFEGRVINFGKFRRDSRGRWAEKADTDEDSDDSKTAPTIPTVETKQKQRMTEAIKNVASGNVSPRNLFTHLSSEERQNHFQRVKDFFQESYSDSYVTSPTLFRTKFPTKDLEVTVHPKIQKAYQKNSLVNWVVNDLGIQQDSQQFFDNLLEDYKEKSNRYKNRFNKQFKTIKDEAQKMGLDYFDAKVFGDPNSRDSWIKAIIVEEDRKRINNVLDEDRAFTYNPQKTGTEKLENPTQIINDYINQAINKIDNVYKEPRNISDKRERQAEKINKANRFIIAKFYEENERRRSNNEPLIPREQFKKMVENSSFGGNKYETIDYQNLQNPPDESLSGKEKFEQALKDKNFNQARLYKSFSESEQEALDRVKQYTNNGKAVREFGRLLASYGTASTSILNLIKDAKSNKNKPSTTESLIREYNKGSVSKKREKSKAQLDYPDQVSVGKTDIPIYDAIVTLQNRELQREAKRQNKKISEIAKDFYDYSIFDLDQNPDQEFTINDQTFTKRELNDAISQQKYEETKNFVAESLDSEFSYLNNAITKDLIDNGFEILNLNKEDQKIIGESLKGGLVSYLSDFYKEFEKDVETKTEANKNLAYYVPTVARELNLNVDELTQVLTGSERAFKNMTTQEVTKAYDQAIKIRNRTNEPDIDSDPTFPIKHIRNQLEQRKDAQRFMNISSPDYKIRGVYRITPQRKEDLMSVNTAEQNLTEKLKDLKLVVRGRDNASKLVEKARQFQAERGQTRVAENVKGSDKSSLNQGLDQLANSLTESLTNYIRQNITELGNNPLRNSDEGDSIIKTVDRLYYEEAKEELKKEIINNRRKNNLAYEDKDKEAEEVLNRVNDMENEGTIKKRKEKKMDKDGIKDKDGVMKDDSVVKTYVDRYDKIIRGLLKSGEIYNKKVYGKDSDYKRDKSKVIQDRIFLGAPKVFDQELLDQLDHQELGLLKNDYLLSRTEDKANTPNKKTPFTPKNLIDAGMTIPEIRAFAPRLDSAVNAEDHHLEQFLFMDLKGQGETAMTARLEHYDENQFKFLDNPEAKEPYTPNSVISHEDIFWIKGQPVARHYNKVNDFLSELDSDRFSSNELKKFVEKLGGNSYFNKDEDKEFIRNNLTKNNLGKLEMSLFHSELSNDKLSPDELKSIVNELGMNPSNDYEENKQIVQDNIDYNTLKKVKESKVDQLKQLQEEQSTETAGLIFDHIKKSREIRDLTEVEKEILSLSRDEFISNYNQDRRFRTRINSDENLVKDLVEENRNTLIKINEKVKEHIDSNFYLEINKIDAVSKDSINYHNDRDNPSNPGRGFNYDVSGVPLGLTTKLDSNGNLTTDPDDSLLASYEMYRKAPKEFTEAIGDIQNQFKEIQNSKAEKDRKIDLNADTPVTDRMPYTKQYLVAPQMIHQQSFYHGLHFMSESTDLSIESNQKRASKLYHKTLYRYKNDIPSKSNKLGVDNKSYFKNAMSSFNNKIRGKLGVQVQRSEDDYKSKFQVRYPTEGNIQFGVGSTVGGKIAPSKIPTSERSIHTKEAEDSLAESQNYSEFSRLYPEMLKKDEEEAVNIIKNRILSKDSKISVASPSEQLSLSPNPLQEIKEDMRKSRNLLSELKYENQNNYQSVMDYNRLLTHYNSLKKELKDKGEDEETLKRIDERIKKIKSDLAPNLEAHYDRRQVEGVSLKDATTRYLEQGESEIKTPEVKEKFENMAQQLDKTDLEKRLGVGSQPKHFYEKLMLKRAKNRESGQPLLKQLSNQDETLQRTNEQEFLELQDRLLDIEIKGALS